MTRYYSPYHFHHARLSGITINEILTRLFVLTWDAKHKLHHFTSLYYAERGYVVLGKILAFETSEHEREFLDFHPDVTNIRKVKRTSYSYCECPVNGINYDDLPIYKKGNRWFWKC